jgi:hypothetical protein
MKKKTDITKVSKSKKTATKIKATKTKVAKSKEVADVLGIEGPVLIFPEKDVQRVLTQKEYNAQFGMMFDISLEDKTFYKRFKFSLDKNSKILHAVSIQPCCSALCGSDNENQYISESDIKSFFKFKAMCKDWMNRHMVNNVLVFRSTITQVWGATSDIEADVYTTPSFDIIFQSNQAARKYMNMLKTYYKVRISVDS